MVNRHGKMLGITSNQGNAEAKANESKLHLTPVERQSHRDQRTNTGEDV